MDSTHILLCCFLFIYTCCKRTGCFKVMDENEDCLPGYHGQNCSEQCRYPNYAYGTYCQGFCECKEQFCDIATGCFSPDVGCRNGYFGDRCVNRCRYPTYGKDCQKACQCIEPKCISPLDVTFLQVHYINQSSGYLYTTMTQHNAERSSMAVIVAVSVLSSIFVSAFITLVIWRLKNRDVTKRRTSQHISPQREQRQVFKDTNNEAAKNYCSSDNSRPSHKYTSSTEVSTDLTHPGFDRNVMQRESIASTIIFDINSCTYEPVLYAFGEDKIAKV